MAWASCHLINDATEAARAHAEQTQRLSRTRSRGCPKFCLSQAARRAGAAGPQGIIAAASLGGGSDWVLGHAGPIADETGLTVREAFTRHEARQRTESLQDESLDAIEARFTEAEASGSLIHAVCEAGVAGR